MTQPTHNHTTQHNTTSTTIQLTTHYHISNPSTNPDCTQDLAPDPADNSCNQCPHECPTTTWICATYDPVFKSLACLENLTTCLFDKMSHLLNKQHMDTPQNPTLPFTLTLHQKPQHLLHKPIGSQQQRSFLFPLFCCQLPSSIIEISL